jgi:hypothetical protein
MLTSRMKTMEQVMLVDGAQFVCFFSEKMHYWSQRAVNSGMVTDTFW